MTSGTTRYQPLSTRGTRGMMIAIPTAASRKPTRMTAAESPLAGAPPGDDGRGEHGQRQGSQRQPGLHGVVLEGHLQEERQRDHRAAQGDLLQQLSTDCRW